MTKLKQQLKKYLSNKQIDYMIKRIEETRKWYDPFFKKQYIKRRLFKILSNYQLTNEL